MSRLCRIFLAWILMLALPLQGYAAAAMTDCHSASVPAMPMAAMEHHHAATQDRLMMHPAHFSIQDSHRHDAAQSRHSCCVACCMGVITAGVNWHLPTLAEHHTLHPDAVASGIPPARLERPPRPA